MTYTKTEKYTFHFPKEFEAYREFIHRLSDLDARFHVIGGASSQTIELTERGEFSLQDGFNLVGITEQNK